MMTKITDLSPDDIGATVSYDKIDYDGSRTSIVGTLEGFVISKGGFKNTYLRVSGENHTLKHQETVWVSTRGSDYQTTRNMVQIEHTVAKAQRIYKDKEN